MGAQPRVLIVEDTLEYAQIVQTLLQRAGIQTHHVSDGYKALDYLEERKPDAMLLDIGMPGMNGWQVLDAVKARFPDADFPVIVLTAFNDPANKLIGKFQSRVYQYYTKPFDLKLLPETVWQAVRVAA